MRQSGIAVYVHLVWSTWDRLPLLVGEVERRVHRAITSKCQELGADVIALGGVDDHIHLLTALPPTITLANLVGQVKGASSHLATHKALPSDAFFKWQGAYGAVSVTPHLLPQVVAYISHQREHHAHGSLITEWEHLPSHPKPANVASNDASS